MTDRAQRDVLRPYVPRLLGDWLATTPDEVHRSIVGTALFADLSGFTRLTERLSRHGRIGAEEMSDALNATFAELLGVADAQGADLVKWGGDAVMLLFEGPGHAARACTAAYGMRGRLREVGHLKTSAGLANLRMSVGVAGGEFHFFLVGDPELHRELVICGPDVSRVVELEGLAQAGEIAVAEDTVASIGPEHFGGAVAEIGRLLRRPPGTAGGRVAQERSGIDLSQFVPVAIRRHLLAGAGEPEHRTIAVAFVAFAGTDTLLREEGPEATAAALDEVVRMVSQAAAELDVTFFESDVAVNGGKIMLTAGAPRSAGHDVDRMLRAMRKAMDGRGRLPLRIGVNAGPVFAGDFGPPFRRTYSVKGDAINLAARVMSRAQPGQVLVTADAYSHSTTLFEVEHLEPFRAKGKTKPVQALALGPVIASRGPVPANSSTDAPLTGRKHEMQVLGDLLDRLRGREGAVAQVLGDPGIGKSRLIAELVEKAGDVTVLAVQCDEYAAARPYHAMQGLLGDLTGLTGDPDPALAAERLMKRIAFDAPQLVPWLPLLGTPLDIPIMDTPETAGLSDQFRKQRLEEIAGDFLHALLPTPTLITIDDGQHMDGASADLLTHLVSRPNAEPWLFVIGRRDRPLGWQPPAGLPITTLRLPPLSAAESLALVRAATSLQPLPRPTLEALAAKADGNPLFLESLVAAAGPSGSVENLPESVHDLVTTQIDLLAPRDRAVLRIASVLGMRVDTPDLQRLLENAPDELSATSYERLREFLVPETSTRLRFRHAMIRDVAYEGLPYRTRQRLHAEVASALEQAGAATDGPELLSLHFFHAKRFEKAWHYSCAAGHRARSKYANHDAVELFRRAVASEKQGPSGMVQPHELGEVFETLGDTLYTIGLLEQASQQYKDAQRLFADNAVRAGRIVAKEADVDRRLRRLPQSLRRITAALHKLDDADHSKEASIARAHLAMRYARTRFIQGRADDALAWGDRAAREAEESTDKPTLAQAYTTLHYLLDTFGRESDIPYGELALAAYTELDDLSGQGQCLNNLAVAAYKRFEWVEAASKFGRAADIYRRIGDTAAEANSQFNRADVLVHQGHCTEARQLLSEVVLAARSVSDNELVAMSLRETGRCDCRLGNIDVGLTGLHQARQVFLELDETDEIAATDLAIAEALLLCGDPEGALHACEDLGSPDDGSAAGVHWVRGFAHLAAGRMEPAAAEFAEGIEVSAREDDRYAGALNTIGLAQVSSVEPAPAFDVLTSLGVVELPVRLPALEH